MLYSAVLLYCLCCQHKVSAGFDGNIGVGGLLIGGLSKIEGSTNSFLSAGESKSMFIAEIWIFCEWLLKGEFQYELGCVVDAQYFPV